MIRKGKSLAWLADEPLEPSGLAMEHAMDISASVYERLRELGMTQTELAGAMNLSAGRVSQIMRGEPGMTLKTLAKLENALGFRMDEGFRYRASKSGSSSVVVS